MKPTKEQIQWLWEQCGFKHIGHTALGDIWEVPDGGTYCDNTPPVDLNNLFKYAVPTALIRLADIDLSTIMEAYYKLFAMWIKLMMEPPDTVGIEARSLFWAIFTALGGKE